MMKISRKTSTTLSFILAILFMAGLIATAFLLPWMVPKLIDLPDNVGSRDQITDAGRILVLACSYLALLLAEVADILLLQLLKSVRGGNVFTPRCVGLIRGISWCLILFGAAFLPIAFYFQLAFIVSFAGVFLGLCVRVVKNAFEEAVALKEENDLTV